MRPAKIVDAQYFYWWMNDLKHEEWAEPLFEKEIDCWYNRRRRIQEHPDGLGARREVLQRLLNSAHMGHNPLVWFMDDDHARGVFLV